MLCCVMRLTQNQKAQQTQYCNMVILFEKTALWYLLPHDFHFHFHILSPKLLMVQTSLGKVPHTHKELIRRVKTFEYVHLCQTITSICKVQKLRNRIKLY